MSRDKSIKKESELQKKFSYLEKPRKSCLLNLSKLERANIEMSRLISREAYRRGEFYLEHEDRRYGLS